MKLFIPLKNISIERRKALYVLSIIFLLGIIVGKQVIIQYLLSSQKNESQYITFLSRQRIICTQIVKAVYQYKENPNTESSLIEKINNWHTVNLSLLQGNTALSIPLPKTSEAYIHLFSEMLTYEAALLDGIEMIKNAQQEKGLSLVLASEEKYMTVLDKMVKQKGAEAGKNYGLVSLIQMVADVLVVIILIGNFLLIMIPFIQLLIQKNVELQTSNEKLGAVLESISDMKFLVDNAGNIILLNKTAKAGMSFLKEKMLQVKDNILEVIAPQKTGSFYEAFFKALKGNIVTIENAFEKHNITYWYKIEFQPVWNQEHQVTNITLSFVDISEMKNAQIALERQNKDLQEIAHIQSHELRGPLARILGLVGLFDNRYPNDSFNTDIIKNLKISSEELDAVIFKVVAKAEKIDLQNEKN